MHSNRKKISAVTLSCVLALAFVAAGCADAYTESMRSSAKISDSVTEGAGLVGNLYAQGLISKPEKDALASWMIDLTKANQNWRGAIYTIHTQSATAGKVQYLAAASTFIAAVGDPSTSELLHVKNANAQAQLQKWALGAKTLLDGISLAIQKAKGN